MFSQLRGGLLNAGGGGRNGAQEQDDRNQQGAHAASSGITGEEFIQWQQRLIGARQGKEEKLRQDTLVMESSGRRVTQLKTDNEQLAGKEEMLVEESKMEEVVLNDTEVQLDFLEEQLHEASALGGMVKQMQEQEELVKVDQDLRLRVMEEGFRQIQLSDKEEKLKLDEGLRSVEAGVEAKLVRDKGVLETSEKQHSALVESKVVQSCRRMDLNAEVEAKAKINMELEERARVKTEAALERKYFAESKVAEVGKNKNLLEALVNKAAADEELGMKKLSNVKERKKLAKEMLSQVQECVDQLRQAATSRETEIKALQHQAGHLEASKTDQKQRVMHLRGDIDKLNELRKLVEVSLGKKNAAEKQLGILKAIQQEKFGEEEKRVVLQGQVQVAGEQVKLKKEELNVLEIQADSEEANLQSLKTESNKSKERKLDCCTQNDRLHTMVRQNREENRVMFETRVKIADEKLEVIKLENRDLLGLVETLNKEVVESSTKNKKLEQQLADTAAEEAEEEQLIASTKSDKKDLAEAVRKVEEEIERLKCTIHPKEEELTTKKERSDSLAMNYNEVSEERRSVEDGMVASTCSLNKVELHIKQLNSEIEKLKILEGEVGDQLAEASALLEQSERKQELRGEHAENMKKVKKLQKATKQVKSEMTVVTKRKEKLKRQCGKTRLEKSKVEKEIDQVEADIKTAKEGIDEVAATAAADEKALLSRKEELERTKTEVEEKTNQSQVLRSRVKVQSDEIKKAEGLLRKESGKVEEQKMMLEEKQRKGNASVSSTEAECCELEQTLYTANQRLEQSQSWKKQLMENMDKVKEEIKEVEKVISCTASRKTPQQLKKGGDQNRQITPLPSVKKKEVQQESSNLFRTPAASFLRRTPEQLRKASPSIGVTSRGRRSLLQFPESPMLQNKGGPSLKASPAVAPRSPFSILSPSDSI